MQGLPEHMGDALKNKPSFGQSGFRWFGRSSKARRLSGSAYYFNGCKALMFSSVAHFNQATRQLSTWVKAPVSSTRSKRTTGASSPRQPLPPSRGCAELLRERGAARAPEEEGVGEKEKKRGVN